MADDDKALADPQVLRHYLAQLGGLTLVSLGNDELEQVLVSAIENPPDDLLVVRVAQALLEARLRVMYLEPTLEDVHDDLKAARGELGRSAALSTTIRVAIREAGVDLPAGSTVEVMATAIRGLVDPRVAITEGLFSAAQIDDEVDRGPS